MKGSCSTDKRPHRLSVTDQAYHLIAKSAAKHVKSPVTTTSAGKTIPLDDEPGFDAFNR
jgi:hypothetical protein